MIAGLSPEEAIAKPYIASMGIYVFKKDVLIKLLNEVNDHICLPLHSLVAIVGCAIALTVHNGLQVVLHVVVVTDAQLL